MLTITIYKWLPASGKTTHAKEQVLKNPSGITRVNKDELRAMMHCSKYSKSNEKLVLEVRDCIITEALLEGKHVIVDDTNLNPIHEERIRAIAKSLAHKNVQVKIEDFRHVPLKTCIERDAARENPVGKDVITDMYNQYMKHYISPEESNINQNEELPPIIIVDIDWTIANNTMRSPYDYSKVEQDAPYKDIIRLLDALSGTYSIWFVSGRTDECFVETSKWLAENIPFTYEFLKMRKTWDNRGDDVVKIEIIKDIVKNYYVEAIFDDRNRVVDAWRKHGFRCLQVQEWNF